MRTSLAFGALDNALAETTIGEYKTELFRCTAAGKPVNEVEPST